MNASPASDSHALANDLAHALAQGLTLGTIQGFAPEELTATYGVACHLYGQGKYKEAEAVFRFLVLCDHFDPRYWLGLGGCRQQLGEYPKAVEAYSYLAFLDVADPYPPLYASDCHLAMGNHELVRSGLKAALLVAGDNADYARVRERAENFLNALEKWPQSGSGA